MTRLAMEQLESAFAGAGQRPGARRGWAQAALHRLLAPSVVVVGVGPAVAVKRLVAPGPLIVLRSSLPRAADRAQAPSQPPQELAVARLEEEVDERIEGAVGHPHEVQRRRQVLGLPVSHLSGRPRGRQPCGEVGKLATHEQQRQSQAHLQALDLRAGQRAGRRGAAGSRRPGR